ncbi:hypothetical protein BO71DRAFT_417476 [Aspergillus ellipticus CBS 707.79]|uniref:Uncharacterized protein n=1 Tax=Aspergillus ellipticus CBS 707.79 TaxID=1448320 RepID=A0A319DZK9_9EURO|nr:hypothetical protein BO71DRAFT_417476 [Aspergillus ellipticus CBS 707.79]
MNTQSLLHYLSIGLPTIPKQGTNPGPNTTNPQYDADDITQIVPWPEFDYSVIIQRYGELLTSTQIRPDPFTSPPAPLRDEPTFHLRFSDLVMNRVRRGLRVGFEQLAPELQTRQLSVITIDGGGSARIIDQFRPDAAFIWRSSMRSSRDLADQREYKQVLAQLNFYMEQHNARHGFILSDAELVAVKRLDGNGRLAVATSIPWASGGAGRLSVLLGLWYLGMLAAENNNWSLH